MDDYVRRSVFLCGVDVSYITAFSDLLKSVHVITNNYYANIDINDDSPSHNLCYS